MRSSQSVSSACAALRAALPAAPYAAHVVAQSIGEFDARRPTLTPYHRRELRVIRKVTRQLRKMGYLRVAEVAASRSPTRRDAQNRLSRLVSPIGPRYVSRRSAPAHVAELSRIGGAQSARDAIDACAEREAAALEGLATDGGAQYVGPRARASLRLEKAAEIERAQFLGVKAEKLHRYPRRKMVRRWIKILAGGMHTLVYGIREIGDNSAETRERCARNRARRELDRAIGLARLANDSALADTLQTFRASLGACERAGAAA
jgi:hypothetical protein